MLSVEAVGLALCADPGRSGWFAGVRATPFAGTGPAAAVRTVVPLGGAHARAARCSPAPGVPLAAWRYGRRSFVSLTRSASDNAESVNTRTPRAPMGRPLTEVTHPVGTSVNRVTSGGPAKWP